MPTTPIVTVVGYSNTGKTRCLVGLISLLTQRGYRVASAKHCHDGFDLDVEGKDTWKHNQAGARSTLMASRNQVGVIIETSAPLSLAQLSARYLHEVDIVLAEGFSWEPYPKILVVSKENIEQERVSVGEALMALVGEIRLASEIPFFTFNELEALASMLEKQFLLSTRRGREESAAEPGLSVLH